MKITHTPLLIHIIYPNRSPSALPTSCFLSPPPPTSIPSLHTFCPRSLHIRPPDSSGGQTKRRVTRLTTATGAREEYSRTGMFFCADQTCRFRSRENGCLETDVVGLLLACTTEHLTVYETHRGAASPFPASPYPALRP